MKYKKTQGLPINVLVMLILGIIIFGIGIGLFAKISSSGDDKIEELNKQIKTNINSLECDGENWICAPVYEIKNGKSATFQIYIANRAEEKKEYKIEFGDGNSNKIDVSKQNYGNITISYLKDNTYNIQSGESAKIPFIANANMVKKTGGSFITTVKLIDVNNNNNEEIDKTSVIIKVE